MANEEKPIGVPYVIVFNIDPGKVQVEVNKYINKGYVPFGVLTVSDKIYSQALIDPLIPERQQLTVREVTNIKKGTIASTVTIPGTVNVSGCECNCG